MRREMVWIENERFRGWACSECAWEFNPSGVPTGNSIAEMKLNYERQRDTEFRSHLCANHPKAQDLNASRTQQLNKAKSSDATRTASGSSLNGHRIAVKNRLSPHRRPALGGPPAYLTMLG